MRSIKPCALLLYIVLVLTFVYNSNRGFKNSFSPDYAYLKYENFGLKCKVVNQTVQTEALDLRLIVLTYNRVRSLHRLLHSLNNARYGGDKIHLDIWVDRSTDGTFSQALVQATSQFKFAVGTCNIHVQKTHIGIRGQWLDVSNNPFKCYSR